MPTIEALKARIAKASAKFEAAKSKVLSPGDYEFTIKDAREEHDAVREYNYLFLRLECDGQTTTDRFPLTDNMMWKLEALLDSVSPESLRDLRDLIGLPL
jgi:hypothetical protein